jgi:hypothetical protein
MTEAHCRRLRACVPREETLSGVTNKGTDGGSFGGAAAATGGGDEAWLSRSWARAISSSVPGPDVAHAVNERPRSIEIVEA